MIEAEVHLGDCRQIMRWEDLPKVNLIFADPPYNLKQDYDACDDNRSRDEYLTWSREWIEAAGNLLDDHGSMLIMIGDGFVSELDMFAKSIGLHKKNHIVWYFTFGQNNRAGFTRSHVHILHYTRHKTKYTFNKDEPLIRHPSARQLKYKDKRANPKGRLPDDTWAIFPDMLPEGFKPLEDTWEFSRICGTFNEKEAVSPNQLPLPLLERIVLMFSKPGDRVMDPFSGTGTTAEASVMHGRHFVGMDVSQLCVDNTRQRIARARETAVKRQASATEQGKLF